MTSPRTSCSSTAFPSPRSGDACGPTRGSSSSSNRRSGNDRRRLDGVDQERGAGLAGAGAGMKRILWDVDTQVDFVESDGKLAVPDAEVAVPSMARLVLAARTAGIPHVASADDHELTDDEISAEPDFRETYPPHCLRGTRGAQKV